MRRFKTDILVRNNRVKMMQADGLTVNYNILSDDDYAIALKNKMLKAYKSGKNYIVWYGKNANHT